MAGDEARQLFQEGNRLCEEGKYEEAVDSYDKALALDPKDAVAWGLRGIALRHLGRYQEALESYDKALALDPKLAAAWGLRGIALRNLGRYQEAVESYDKALALNPSYHDAWDSRGTMLFRLGRYREALSSYERAASLKPAEPLYHYNCAVALHRLRKGAEAVERLRQALDMDPAFPEAKRALEHMEAGHPVWWWEWWFGESWRKRAVGIGLMVLLGVYLLLPLFSEEAQLPGGIALNVGRSFHYYLVPVAAIVLLLIFPNLRAVGQRGVEFAPLPPKKEEPKLAPLESREAAEERPPKAGGTG